MKAKSSMTGKIIYIFTLLILAGFHLPGISSAGERFVDNGNGTVTDSKTGLMWAAKDNGSDIGFNEAKQICEDSSLAGYTDWRMPDIKELAGLYESDSKNSKGFGITGRINISECCQWSSYASTGVSSLLDFRTGKEIWSYNTDSEQLRILQVRDVK